LGAYRIPSETGLLIPSGYDSGETRAYNFCIAGRPANRGNSNAPILTFALRDCYHYAVMGSINIR